MFYFEWLFNIVQVDTLFNYIDYATFLVIFYVSILIVILVILDIFYVSYSFQQKKFKYVWPLKVLRSACGLLVTVFFLNFLELFCNFLKCTPDEADPNKLVLNLYPEIECWIGLQLLHTSFAVAVSFVFIIICLIAALALFETKESPNDVCAKVTSRPDFTVLVVKIIILYQYSFFYQQENHWFVISTTFIMSLIIYKGFRDNWPYYSDYMNRLMSLVSGLFLWGNFVLIIVKILEKTEFDGGIQIYFLGLPLVGLMIVYGKDERVELLNRNINNFQRGEDMALQIRYFLNLVQTRETERRNAIILRGYIYHHEDSCSYPECCLAQYKELMKQTIAYKNSQQGKESGNGSGALGAKSHKAEMQKLLLQHAKNMYKAAMRKFPTCTALRIQYAFFLLEHMKRKQEAIAELNFANQFSPSFEEKFIIFRYLKMSEDYDDVGEGGQNANGGEEMDVVAKFAYESSLRQFQENIMKSAQYHAEFWNYLKSDRPDMSKLNECGSNINNSVVQVEQYWEQLQKLSPNQPQVMKTYSRYLTQVLNDTQRGQELMARAKEATSGAAKGSYLDADGGFDFNDLSKNGSPCIVVSGRSDEMGKILSCNQSSSRIFGFTVNEMLGQNVETLMPPLYAKHHSKVLRAALQRGPEHIPSKERFVFAQHKNGYIFPVFLQLKYIQSKNSGATSEQDDEEEQAGQFVAIFKIDKKLMSSNIGFILVDRERKIQAISSSCISMLYMDNNRMKKLKQTSVTIDQLAPEIFENLENIAERQYFQVSWTYQSDLEREASITKQRSVSSSENNPNQGSLVKLKTVNIQLNQIRGDFMCSVTPLLMGDIGEVAQCVRLETIQVINEGSGAMNSAAKEGKSKQQRNQQFPIPQFQFRFDGRKCRYIRDLPKEQYSLSNNKNNADYDTDAPIKNQDFLKYQIQGEFNESMFGESLVRTPTDQSQDSTLEAHQNNTNSLDESGIDLSQRTPLIPETETHQSPSGPKSSSKKLKFQDIHTLMQRKRDWGRNITIYQLVDGKFVNKVSEEELKRQMEQEEMRKRQIDDYEEEQTMTGFDSVGGNLNSKKALQTALKDRRPIASITRLKFVMNIAMLCLIILAAAECLVIGNYFGSINDNFNLIKKSYGRISELQRVAFDLRQLTLINENILSPQTPYIKNSSSLPTFLRDDVKEALTQLYDYQAALSLSPLSMSRGQKRLMYEKSVEMMFKDKDGETIKRLKFTLNEAVLQILSAIFTAKHLNFSEYTESNEDLNFINMNLYNDLLLAMRQSAQHYVEDLIERADGEFKIIIAIFLISAFTLLITLAILFPVVRSVNAAKLKILSLFVDIPYSIAITLSAKCEKFIVANAENEQMHANAERTEIGSEDLMDEGSDNHNEEIGIQNSRGKNEVNSGSSRKSANRARIPIFQKTMNDNQFFMQFGFAMLVLLAYFIAMLVISLQYTSRIKLITEEMNLIAQSESYYGFAQNVQRELIYNPTKTVLNDKPVFLVAKDSLEILYAYNELMLNAHFKNRADLNQNYYNEFEKFYKSNICESTTVIKIDLIPFDCTSYQYAQMGLQALLTRYFEQLKDTLKDFVEGVKTSDLVNSPKMTELYVLQFRLIGDSLRYLVNKLTVLTNQEYEGTLSIKLIAFVVFVIALCLAYLALWLPFVIKMSKDMWRSKSMLSIIPIEVILRMPRINQFLLKQSFSDGKQQQKAGPSKPHKGTGEEDDND